MLSRSRARFPMLKKTDLGVSSLGAGVETRLLSLGLSIKLILRILNVEGNIFKLNTKKAMK